MWWGKRWNATAPRLAYFKAQLAQARASSREAGSYKSSLSCSFHLFLKDPGMLGQHHQYVLLGGSQPQTAWPKTGKFSRSLCVLDPSFKRKESACSDPAQQNLSLHWCAPKMFLSHPFQRNTKCTWACKTLQACCANLRNCLTWDLGMRGWGYFIHFLLPHVWQSFAFGKLWSSCWCLWSGDLYLERWLLSHP